MKKILFLTLLLPTVCLGSHPFIGDDSGTQGAGKWQLELNVDNSSKETSCVRTKINTHNGTLTYGLTDQIDIALNEPYQRVSGDAEGLSKHSDTALLLKWRFYEQDGFSLALKPQITLPTGDEEQGFGNGRTTYWINTLIAYETNGVTMFSNVGYTYNDNSIGNRKDVWNISAAGLVSLNPKAKLALDFGSYRNPNPNDRRNPVFAVIGFIYRATDGLDIDVGYKKGLNESEVDYSWGTGLAYRW